ncbi:MAG: pyrroline-5-carboxylate reductase [Thermoleophilia bacterium]
MTAPYAYSTIGIIGAGNMGGALVRGLLAGTPERTVFLVSDADAGRAVEVAGWSPGRVAARTGASEVVAGSDLLLVSVKPQDMPPLLAQLSSHLHPGTPVVSTAAGVTLARLREGAGPAPLLFRIMPNLAVAVGEGVVALAAEEGPADGAAAESHLHALRSLFGCLGVVEILGERYFDVVTAVTGSGPGFLALVLEGLEDGAVRAGLPRQVARAFVRQTAAGTAKLLQEGTASAAELKDRVSSPGGTTIAGLAVLEDRGVRGALLRAVEAAADRGRQL